MPAPLKIKLTPEQDRTLLELSAADGVPRRTKYRAIAYGRAKRQRRTLRERLTP